MQKWPLYDSTTLTVMKQKWWWWEVSVQNLDFTAHYWFSYLVSIITGVVILSPGTMNRLWATLRLSFWLLDQNSKPTLKEAQRQNLVSQSLITSKMLQVHANASVDRKYKLCYLLFSSHRTGMMEYHHYTALKALRPNYVRLLHTNLKVIARLENVYQQYLGPYIRYGKRHLFKIPPCHTAVFNMK